jgi:hypothetical protein
MPLAGEAQITGDNLQMVLASNPTGTLPTPMAPTFAALTAAGGSNPYIGQWVTVPAGSYTEDYTDPAFTYETYQDGVSLTDGSGNKLYIDTYTFSHSTGNCLPTDGGQPDLHLGNFSGAFDTEQADDNLIHNVLFYGGCGN